ncbi:MAG: secondary thiamine-phosphate synthase enzyme YjbQ [Kiritimatiellia bacterium]
MQKLDISTINRTDFVNITSAVQSYIEGRGIQDGLVTVFVPHTTAGVTINENADPDVVHDMIHVLDKIVPWHGGYRHSEGNTAAHVKASLMGSSAQIIIQNGHLALGTWQGIFFCEFDGPRKREVWIRICADQ